MSNNKSVAITNNHKQAYTRLQMAKPTKNRIAHVKWMTLQYGPGITTNSRSMSCFTGKIPTSGNRMQIDS